MLLAIAVTLFLLAYLLPRIFLPPDPNLVVKVFTRLLALCLLLLGYGWVTAYFSLTGLEMTRDARFLRQQAGQIFEERFRILNRSRFPRLWIEIQDESPLPGGPGTRVLSRVGARESRVYTAYTQLHSRGAFPLGPTRLVSGDVFGLFSNERVIPAQHELLVMPLTVDLTRFPSPQGVFPGGRAILQRATEVTPQAAGVREYIPGDGLRSIHWPTTARRGRLMVKEYEQDPQADVWVVLDAYRPSHVLMRRNQSAQHIRHAWQLWQKDALPELPPDTFEYAVSAAASIAQYYVKQGRAVGFTSVTKTSSFFPPERGERQMNKLLEHLTHLDCDGSLPLAGLVEMQARHIARASTVVLVTPEFDETLYVAVNHLTMRNLRPILVQVDPSTFMDRALAGLAYGLTPLTNTPVIRLIRGGNLKEMLEKPIGVSGYSDGPYPPRAGLPAAEQPRAG